MDELEIVQYRQMEGLSLFFDTVDYRTPHVHPEWELIWITEGGLSVACDQSTYAAEKGDMILFSPNQPHEFHKTGKSCTFLCLQVTPQRLPGTAHLWLDNPQLKMQLSESEYDEARRILLRMAEAYFSLEQRFELLCVGNCSLLFHMLLQKMPCHDLSAEELASIGRRNDRMKRLIKFVDENYMHKVRLTDFAAEEGCSVSYLSHAVRESLNQTFQEYVNSVRLNCACRMMETERMRMLDICMESGFSDYRYFSRAFRERFGMTPEEYSRQVKRPEQAGSPAHRSLHSMERFYTRRQSISLLEELK